MINTIDLYTINKCTYLIDEDLINQKYPLSITLMIGKSTYNIGISRDLINKNRGPYISYKNPTKSSSIYIIWISY